MRAAPCSAKLTEPEQSYPPSFQRPWPPPHHLVLDPAEPERTRREPGHRHRPAEREHRPAAPGLGDVQAAGKQPVRRVEHVPEDEQQDARGEHRQEAAHPVREAADPADRQAQIDRETRDRPQYGRALWTHRSPIRRKT